MKNEFVTIVNHELRTPLTSLKGSLQFLTTDDDEIDTAMRVELAAAALRNTDRLIRIVNDILDLSKIEAGHMQVHRVPTAIGDVATEACGALEQFASDHRVALDASGLEGLPRVSADPDRTIQVLVNLMSNAVKFSPEGSTVRVTAAVEGDMLRTSVIDQGEASPATVSTCSSSGSSRWAKSTSARSRAPGSAWRSRKRSSSCTAARSPSPAKRGAARRSASHCRWPP